MCPSESRVILNYDNIPGLESRYRNAVIQPYNPGRSHAKYYMADTVHMAWRRDMSCTDMERMAKDAAPLAERVVIDGMPDGQSHDIPYRYGDRAYMFA
jgi:hypothetical protein